jgi:GT2 family glycosyltransferase
LKILTCDKMGYAKVNNAAVRKANGTLVLFLNNDVFPEKYSIGKMAAYLENDPTVGVIQGLLLYAGNNLVQSTGHIFGQYFNFHALEGRSNNDPIVHQMQERQGLSSAFFMVRRSLFLEKGCFDEFYYNGWEGIDISLHIHFSGYKCLYYPLAIGHHIRKGTRKEVIASNQTQQTAYFWAKWGKLIRDDLLDIIKMQLDQIPLAESYLAINATFLSSLKELIASCGLNCTGYVDVRDRFNLEIDFYQNLSYAVKVFSGPLLFIVNSIRDIASNQYWVQTRNNKSDLVIDLRGNVINLIDYFR